MASDQRLSIFQNADKDFALDCDNADGTPIDLTGGRLTFTVRRQTGDAATSIVKDSDTPGEIDFNVDPTTGLATLRLNPADTASLAIGKYRYDLWFVSAAGEQYPLIEDTLFSILKPITESP